MPTLNEEEKEEFLGQQALICNKCGKPMSRGYCRSCDEFYFTCGCNKKTGHEEHRTY